MCPHRYNIRIMCVEFDDDHNHQVEWYDLCIMGNRDVPTSRVEASVWYIKSYDDKPEEPAANKMATDKSAFKDWMNSHCVAWSTIQLCMELGFHADYMVADDANTLWEPPASVYQSEGKLNICKIIEDHWSINQLNCRDVDNYTLLINRMFKDYILYREGSTTDTDATNTDYSKTIAKSVMKKTDFTLFRGSRETKRRKFSLTLWLINPPWWPLHPMRLSPSSTKMKL